MIEKKNNPTFKRQDAHKKGRLKGKWRSARGLQSKIRLAKKGYGKKPKTGYRNAKIIRGLIKSIEFVEISTLKELENVPKNTGIIIKTIGLKKKLDIVKKAITLKIKILNIKDADKFLKEKEAEIKQKKEAKKKKAASRVKHKTIAEDKSKVKQKKEETADVKKEKTEEELKAEKKAEAEKKNKILTQKNQ
ncbi:MAG: hypothetical protein KAQ83_00790 [Nanoarchaeota archaeon]|nr:hypothetical protein [Nanoarchaeota archaeon]